MLPDGTSLPKQQGGVVNGREMHIDAVRIRVGLDLEVGGMERRLRMWSCGQRLKLNLRYWVTVSVN